MLRPILASAALAWSLLLVVPGCDRSKTREPAPAPATSAGAAPAPRAASAFDAGALAVSRPAPERVVAIGDLHGDLEATRKVLRLAGAIDMADRWTGGSLVLVQTGDQIDRGDNDRKILDLFDRLKQEAKQAGGEVVALVGNHEVMNAMFDFRYVTPGAYEPFAGVSSQAVGLERLDPAQRGRAAAFAPGGPYARTLAQRPVVARVGDSIFVHGGVLPKHVRYGLDRMNDEMQRWLEGRATEPPRALVGEDAPTWSRMYSTAPGREECATLTEVLTLLRAKRMVMGHTPQKTGISSACDGRAWRIDVGLAKFYGGPSQALEVRGDEVKVLGVSGPMAP